MRDMLFVVLVTLACVPIGVGQTSSQKSEKELKIQEEVISIDKNWGEAVAKSDRNALNRILADDFIAVGTRGEISDKKQSIENLPPPGSTYKADEYSVRILDNNTVLVIHRGTYDAQEDGRKVSESHRSLHVFVKRQGRWQVVASGQAPII